MEQRFYEDLKMLEKMKLRREFNGFFSRGLIGLPVCILAFGVMLAGCILLAIFYLSPNRQYWQLSGITMLSAGMFVLFSIMLMIASKEKNLLKAIGSKKRVASFFIAFAISVVGNVFVMIFIFSSYKETWLYWASNIMTALGAFIFLIPHVSSKNNMVEIKKQEEDFYIWLEKEKNIIRSQGDKGICHK